MDFVIGDVGWWRLFPGIMSLIIVTYGVSSSNHVGMPFITGKFW